MRPLRLVAGVVAELEELLDVGVPRLEVDAAGALSLAALVHRGHRRVERLQPRHDPVGVSVRALDERAARADAVVREPDASRELREQRDVGVALVDVLEVVLRRVEEEAARELLVARPRVEERRRARQVFERREQPIELEGLGHVLGERARDPEEELLRRLDHEARLRVLEEVAVVDGAQAEVLELAIALRIDRVVELARVLRDEARGDAR